MEGNSGNATLSAVVVHLGCNILSYRLGSVLHSCWGSLGLLSLLYVKVQVVPNPGSLLDGVSHRTELAAELVSAPHNVVRKVDDTFRGYLK